MLSIVLFSLVIAISVIQNGLLGGIFVIGFFILGQLILINQKLNFKSKDGNPNIKYFSNLKVKFPKETKE